MTFITFLMFVVNLDETSTGVLYDIEMISEFCKRNNLFLLVDSISSFLCDPFDMEKLGVNCVITGSQKALALAPGISLIVLDSKAIDRINNNGNYEPLNCRWVTAEEQQKNTRNNRNITFNNKTQILADWAKEIGINIDTLWRRLKCGWSIERALTTPLLGGKCVKK